MKGKKAEADKKAAETKQMEFAAEPLAKLSKRLATLAKKGRKGGYALTEKDAADIEIGSKLADMLYLFCKKGEASVVRNGDHFTTLHSPQLKALASSLAHHAIMDANPGSED